MARIVHTSSYPPVTLPRAIDLGRLLFTLFQLAVLGGIGVFLAIAVINSLLGTPQAEPVYNPYP